MNIIYQNLEDFMKKLETLGKETIIYMSTVFSRDTANKMMGSVRCQFHDGFGIFHVYNTSDGITSVTTLEDDSFSNIDDDALRKQMQQAYLDKLKLVEDQTKAGFEKNKTSFTSHGFKVVEAYIQ